MTLNRAFPGRVFFDHLPKTAGSAINQWLMDSLGSGCVSPTYSGYHRDLICQYGGLYSVICAHAHFVDKEGLDQRYQYITFLRDPVDRVVSWLYFVINDHNISHPSHVMALVHRFLDSDGKDLAEELISNISNMCVEHFCRIEGSSTMCDDEKIANALAVIKKYDVVGSFDNMPGFLIDVANMIGLPPPEAIARVNVTSKRPKVGQISTALRKRIETLNQLDLRLYSEVLAWKARSSQSKTLQSPKVRIQHWNKYEREVNRIIRTPDIIIGKTALREGYHIRHKQLISFDVDFFLTREVKDLETGIHIFDSGRRWAFGTNNTMLGKSHSPLPRGSYRVSHHLVADLPAGRYTAGFAFAEKLQEGQKELAWHDVLCEFQVNHEATLPHAGYAYLPAQISLRPTMLAAPEFVVNQASGILAVAAPVKSVVAGTQTLIGVEITNKSEQAWVGDTFRPVNLSYHWMKDSGETVIYDGLRSPLPEGGIASGQKLVTEMSVDTPPDAGNYTLVLTLVQEGVRWFEDSGFEAAKLKVEVINTAESGGK